MVSLPTNLLSFGIPQGVVQGVVQAITGALSSYLLPITWVNDYNSYSSALQQINPVAGLGRRLQQAESETPDGSALVQVRGRASF